MSISTAKLNWRQFPELDQQLIACVEEGTKSGRSKASCFKEFAAKASLLVGFSLTDKACEIRYTRLTGQIPSSSHPQTKEQKEDGHTPRSSAWKADAVANVARLVANGSTIRAACAKVASEVRRKARTVRNAYEEWKKEQGEAGQAPSPVAVPTREMVNKLSEIGNSSERNEEDLLLEAIGKLFEFGPRIKDFDLATFANGLSVLVRHATLPVAAAQDAEQVAGLREQVSLLQKDVTRLQQELSTSQVTEDRLRRENAFLRSQINEVRTDYARYHLEIVTRWKDMEELCNDHLSQSLSDRFRAMRSFGERLRTTVDHFGVAIANAPTALGKNEGMVEGAVMPLLETNR